MSMNKLEQEIMQYLIDNDINEMTAQNVADYYFVSRPLVYKVLNKMGYQSLTTFKEEKKKHRQEYMSRYSHIDIPNPDVIESLQIEVCNANRIYVVGFFGSEVVVEYLCRQLVNLNCVVIGISDKYQLKGHMNMISNKDVLIFVSNTGLDQETYESFTHLKCNKYVLTQKDSPLYNITPNHIGVVNNIKNLSDRFERENTIELLTVIQLLLNKIRIYKEDMNENTIIM